MEATSFLLPIIFIWPLDRARECAGAQETLRSVYGMPRCLLSSGDARCFILQHTRTHSLRHCPISPPNKTIIKQHTCPTGPMKHFTQESLSKEGKIISSLIMVPFPNGQTSNRPWLEKYAICKKQLSLVNVERGVYSINNPILESVKKQLYVDHSGYFFPVTVRCSHLSISRV